VPFLGDLRPGQHLTGSLIHINEIPLQGDGGKTTWSLYWAAGSLALASGRKLPFEFQAGSPLDQVDNVAIHFRFHPSPGNACSIPSDPHGGNPRLRVAIIAPSPQSQPHQHITGGNGGQVKGTLTFMNSPDPTWYPSLLKRPRPVILAEAPMGVKFPPRVAPIKRAK